MIKVELVIDNVDYDLLAERYLPYFVERFKNSSNPAMRLMAGGVPVSTLKKFFSGLSQDAKDKMAAQLLNSNKELLIENAKATMENMGMHADIIEAKAST